MSSNTDLVKGINDLATQLGTDIKGINDNIGNIVKVSKSEPNDEKKPLLWVQPVDGNNTPIISISYDIVTHELVLGHMDNSESRVDLSSIKSFDANSIVIDNNKPIKGRLNDTNKTEVQLIKTSSGVVEVGDKTANTVIVGKEVKTWDGGDASYTLLSTKHYGNAIYSKKQSDDTFIRKDELVKLSIDVKPDFVGQLAVVGDKTYIAINTTGTDGWKAMGGSSNVATLDKIRFTNGAELWIE